MCLALANISTYFSQLSPETSPKIVNSADPNYRYNLLNPLASAKMYAKLMFPKCLVLAHTNKKSHLLNKYLLYNLVNSQLFATSKKIGKTITKSSWARPILTKR